MKLNCTLKSTIVAVYLFSCIHYFEFVLLIQTKLFIAHSLSTDWKSNFPWNMNNYFIVEAMPKWLLDTNTEKLALGIVIFPTPPELIFVVFRFADMIIWFLASHLSLMRHGWRLHHGICDPTRWRKEMDILFLYLPPACISKYFEGSGFPCF